MNPLHLSHRELHTKLNRFRNINLMSIAYATRLGLGPTNPGMITIARKPCSFGRQDSHLSYGYSFQHSHFLTLHQTLQYGFTADRNAPLPLHARHAVHIFGITLSPVISSTQNLLTSELLRTL